MTHFFQATTQTARKDYNCDACDWLFNTGIDEGLLTFTERRAVVKAIKQGYKVKKGQTYLKQHSVDGGDFFAFKAIPEINDICHKYEIYQYE